LGDQIDDPVELGLRRAALGRHLVETGQDLARGGRGRGGHGDALSDGATRRHGACAPHPYDIHAAMYIRSKKMGVKVSEWGNSLGIRIPKDVVDALGLKKGDEMEVRLAGERTLEVARDDRRERALERMRELARPL